MPTTTTTSVLHAQWDNITVARARQRRGFKWAPYSGTDHIPAWVADMDIPASASIAEAIADFYSRGDLGYFDETIYTTVRETCSQWFSIKHGWHIRPGDIELVSDTVQSLHLMVQHYSHPGDRIALITPVYHHFYNAIVENGRIPAPVALKEARGGYVLDTDELRDQLAQDGTKLLLLCHPHNPTGKVFTPEELRQMAQAAAETGTVVISDEIHADLTYDPGAFTPFAVVGAELPTPSITLTSAGKAFNIAGTHLGFVVYSSSSLRQQAPRFPSRSNGKPGIAGCIATNVAWSSQEPWLDAAVSYLRRNRDHFFTALAQEVPELEAIPPEATYLAWLNLNQFTSDAREFLIEKAQVVTSGGRDFSWPRGTGGEYARLNFAAPFPLVQEITERVVDALTAERKRRSIA